MAPGDQLHSIYLSLVPQLLCVALQDKFCPIRNVVDNKAIVLSATSNLCLLCSDVLHMTYVGWLMGVIGSKHIIFNKWRVQS